MRIEKDLATDQMVVIDPDGNRTYVSTGSAKHAALLQNMQNTQMIHHVNSQLQNNAYAWPRKPPRFPRSEQEQDDIMLRRVHARERLEKERITRRWAHAAIIAAVVILAPVVVAVVLRLWGASLAWIAS
jgi:hypothetical protein